mmetsp:Transcript_23697/g.73428  ORF Transcript_23697/g.73428 Transcript_23697/m.73428 type:complete len:205 (-) Transcript_23697:1022-1636(-)
MTDTKSTATARRPKTPAATVSPSPNVTQAMLLVVSGCTKNMIGNTHADGNRAHAMAPLTAPPVTAARTRPTSTLSSAHPMRIARFMTTAPKWCFVLSGPMAMPVGWSAKSSGSNDGSHRESRRSAVERDACVALVGVPRPPEIVTATVCVASAATTVSSLIAPRGMGFTGMGTWVLDADWDSDGVFVVDASQNSTAAFDASVGR